MADIFDKLESDISDAIARFEDASKIHLLALEAKDSVEVEWSRLTALELLNGESIDRAISKVHATQRGREVADLIRLRRAESDLSRQSYNLALFDVEAKILKARWTTIREERK